MVWVLNFTSPTKFSYNYLVGDFRILNKLICLLFLLLISCTCASAGEKDDRCGKLMRSIARVEQRIIELRERPVSDDLDVELDKIQINVLINIRTSLESRVKALCWV